MELKDRLKTLRLSRGLTQTDVAGKLGFKTHNGYTLWEKGKTAPSVRDLDMIADVFGISIPELLFNTQPFKPSEKEIVPKDIQQRLEFLERENSILKSFLREKGVDLGKVKGVTNSPELDVIRRYEDEKPNYLSLAIQYISPN